jgi:hypothetical protein
VEARATQAGKAAAAAAAAISSLGRTNVGGVEAVVDVRVHEDVVEGEVLEHHGPHVPVEGVVQEDGQVGEDAADGGNGQDVEVPHHAVESWAKRREEKRNVSQLHRRMRACMNACR